MKLIYYIILRITLALTLILTVWAIFFYVTMIDEVNDEVDDALEDYSETIIIRALAGEELPSKTNGSNNQYYMMEVSKEYAESREDIQYKDSMVYIEEKGETEPARILTTIFKDDEGRYHELTVSTPSIEKDDLRDAIQVWIIFLYVALLFCIIIISVWVFYRNMRPLYVLLHWLDGYQTGKRNKPLSNDTQITEFRKLNEAAIRYVERTEQMFEQQKQFIGNASHEIQTPLAICRNRLEMLMEDDSLSEKQLEELMKTHQTLEYITKLNKSLLLLSKIDNGQFTDTKELELNVLLKQYLQDYEEVYDYRNIEVTIDEQGVFKVTMNESLAVALLTNLLKNAFVHNIDGGHIRITVTKNGITFRNSGVEHPLNKEHIFERFYQADHKGVEETTGNGIGLSLVRDFVTLHEGEVKVFDNIGMGSVFVIQFPVKHVEIQVQLPEETGMPVGDEEDKEMKEEAREETERKNFPLLLIVDDNEDFRIFMRYSLELQYRVKLAVNGKEAWEMMQEELPDLVISDVMMPQMDGNELCRLIKQDKRTAHIPVILLTARQNTEAKLEGLQTGADDYVTKPFNMTILVLRIRKLIELSRYHRVTQGMIDPAPSEIVITSLDEKLIEKAIKYVEDNMSRTELSVEELSRELGMSRVHLYKKLLQITGKTPIEFIRVIRLKRAAQLLRESQLHVSEVAFEVGFNNPKYFSRYFKDEFGVLPSVYQEKEGK